VKPSALVISFILASLASLAQNPEVDSLRLHAKSTPKVKLFQVELCEAFARYGMLDSAQIYLQRSRDRKTESNEIKIRWELIDAQVATSQFDFTSAQAHLDSALRIVRKCEPSFRIQKRVYTEVLNAAAYFIDCEYGLPIADEFMRKAEMEESDSVIMSVSILKVQLIECEGESDSTSQDLLKRAAEIAEANPELKGDYYRSMAWYHYYQNRLPKSIEHNLLAEQFYMEQGPESSLGWVYYDFASAYEDMNDFGRSIEYLKRAKPYLLEEFNEHWDDFYNRLGWAYFRNGQMDSALVAIRESERLYREASPGNPDITFPIGNLGLIYKELGEWDSAYAYSKRAVKLFNDLNHDMGVAEALNNLGSISLEMGKRDSAIAFFDAALDLINGDFMERYEEMKAQRGLYEAYKDHDPQQAIEHFTCYSELKTAIQSRTEALTAVQVEAEFYQDKHDDQVRQLKYESQLKSLEIEQQRDRVMLATSALVIMAVVAGLIFFYWLQRMKMIHSLEESNAINRRIISMISHDFRGPLNNVKLTLELLQDGDMEMSEFLILSKDLYHQNSDLALMFDSFVGWAISQRDGYVPARIPFKWSDVVEEVISISQPLAKLKNIRIKLKAHSSVQVETDRMAASLILRNLVSNAIKYSHHDSIVEIDYIQENDVVRTTIKDHGIGMSQDKLQRILTTGDRSIMGTDNEYGAGLGLRMVIKYVRGIGGVIEADSEENKGTTFVISIPVQLNRPDEF